MERGDQQQYKRDFNRMITFVVSESHSLTHTAKKLGSWREVFLLQAIALSQNSSDKSKSH